MNYFLIRLSFDTAVHIGCSDSAQSLSSAEDHLLADTVFSALCHTALTLYGQPGLDKLLDWVREDAFLLSDTMPWLEDGDEEPQYYLPKPCILPKGGTELPADQAKAMKKMAWIPVNSFSAFSDSIHGGKPYEPERYAVSFGFQTDMTCVRIPRNSEEDSMPYQVGLFQFYPRCGLYLFLGLETQEQEDFLMTLFTSLGMSGIGGKTSSGCGRFHIEDTILLNEFFDDQTQWLYEALSTPSPQNLLLTSSLPVQDELEQALDGAGYQMVRRAGFVSSDTYADSPMKKQTQYFLRSGAVLQNRFHGDLYQIGSGGSHPVYRYGKPLFLGVRL